MDIKPSLNHASSSSSTAGPSSSSHADSKPPVYYTSPPNQTEHLAYNPKHQPDPNIWALKVPRFLWEQWGTIREAGVELGELVIDQKCAADHS